jgi:uncharacterized membrane protein
MFITVDQEDILKKAEEVQKKASQKVKDLEDKIKNAKAIREKELKEAEANVGKAKKKMEESSKKMKGKYQVWRIPLLILIFISFCHTFFYICPFYIYQILTAIFNKLKFVRGWK